MIGEGRVDSNSGKPGGIPSKGFMASHLAPTDHFAPRIVMPPFGGRSSGWRGDSGVDVPVRNVAWKAGVLNVSDVQ
jgi:hypothetical protein